MRYLSFIFFSLVSVTFAKAQYEQLWVTQPSPDSSFGEVPEAKIKVFYQNFLDRYGQDYLLEACKAALAEHGERKEEYAAKLLNELARNERLMQNIDVAKTYYNQVINTDFEPDYYAQGVIADRQKLVALAGLRDLAMQEANYQAALDYHQQYTQKLKQDYKTLYDRNQVRNDRFLATCYQAMGESEQAINCLAPYAFGNGASAGGGLNKGMVDHLVELLLSKYSKKQLRKMLPVIHEHIYVDTKGNSPRFYIDFFKNKIYFPPDSYQYSSRLKHGQAIEGQAIAHYQRKLCNSYFFQQLMQGV